MQEREVKCSDFSSEVPGFYRPDAECVFFWSCPYLRRMPEYYCPLLYLLVSTRAVIGHFSGPYSPVRPAKI